MNWHTPHILSLWRLKPRNSRRKLSCVHSTEPCRCGRQMLSDCRYGQVVQVLAVDSQLGCAQRLRELGILEGASLQLLRGSDPLLVLVKDSRIAIDLQAARCIEVRLREKTA